MKSSSPAVLDASVLISTDVAMTLFGIVHAVEHRRCIVVYHYPLLLLLQSGLLTWPDFSIVPRMLPRVYASSESITIRRLRKRHSLHGHLSGRRGNTRRCCLHATVAEVVS